MPASNRIDITRKPWTLDETMNSLFPGKEHLHETYRESFLNAIREGEIFESPNGLYAVSCIRFAHRAGHKVPKKYSKIVKGLSRYEEESLGPADKDGCPTNTVPDVAEYFRRDIFESKLKGYKTCEIHVACLTLLEPHVLNLIAVGTEQHVLNFMAVGNEPLPSLIQFLPKEKLIRLMGDHPFVQRFRDWIRSGELKEAGESNYVKTVDFVRLAVELGFAEYMLPEMKAMLNEGSSDPAGAGETKPLNEESFESSVLTLPKNTRRVWDYLLKRDKPATYDDMGTDLHMGRTTIKNALDELRQCAMIEKIKGGGVVPSAKYRQD